MRHDIHRPDDEAGEGPGRDPRLLAALRHLDPERREPGYWRRFHSGVMAAARDELARRRMLADVTVSELVASWGRVVVPTAVLAAAVAFLLLLDPATPSGAPQASAAPIALEEVLGEDLVGVPGFEPRPVDHGVMFASEGF